jgi:hypothetical protein
VAPRELLAESPPTHIFVVGVHRSGTTLMRHVLNDHSAVALCDETHYMGHVISGAGMRQHLARFRPLSSDDNVERLVAHMQSPRFRKYSIFKDLGWQWTWFVDSVPREEVLAHLLASDRSEAGIFDAFMTLYAKKRGATVRGEKTPIHLRWSEELLEWYPRSKIIHMMRDPRGVHVSDLKRRREQQKRAPVYKVLRSLGPAFETLTTAETSLMWADSARRAARMARRFPDRYLVVKFEDLVVDPERVIRKLCSDLGLSFEPKMLERTVVSAGFRKGDRGFDVAAARRWSEHISRWSTAWYQWRFSKWLGLFGYER